MKSPKRDIKLPMSNKICHLFQKNKMAGENGNDEGQTPAAVAPVQDELILKQQEEIAAEIAKSSGLISGLEDFSTLVADFQQDQQFLAKIQQISQSYSKLRYKITIRKVAIY